ncbi:MAG: hypothetical protein ACFFG0_23380 [Candidatus Thorarchaeota archaeon]
MFNSHYYEINLDLNGNGAIDNPYILSLKKNYDIEHTTLKISNSKAYMVLKEFNLKALYLYHYENLTILDINVKYLGLSNCNIISIHNICINKQLRIVRSSQIRIANSEIRNVIAFSGDQILFFARIIHKISRKSKAFMYLQYKDMDTIIKNDSMLSNSQSKPNFWTCSSCECDSELNINSLFCHNCGIKLK